MVKPGQNGNPPFAEKIYDSKDLMIKNIIIPSWNKKIYCRNIQQRQVFNGKYLLCT
jgi:hypothetical protein